MTDKAEFEVVKMKAQERLEKKVSVCPLTEDHNAYASKAFDHFKSQQFDAFIRDKFYQCMVEDDLI